ncbi:MAG TPA: HD domain-containing protein [Gammaproteobacteria bacterium]|nr:HD domain-containing protein [Gammaproteobacteria bacterium]
MASPIKDAVHEYIPVTDLEARVIDTPQVQRLRYVLQNSTVFQTYPSNTNTRFAHSLGTMHVAGRLFVGAIENCSNEVIEKLHVSGCKLLAPLTSRHSLSDWEQKYWVKSPGAIGCISNKRICEIKRTDDHYSGLFVFDTLLQAVRVAALCHDLGHMPMSHVFEYALSAGRERNPRLETILREYLDTKCQAYKDRLSFSDVLEEIAKDAFENNELHELEGLFLFDEIFRAVLADGYLPYETLVMEIGRMILLVRPSISHQKDQINLLAFLHSFFSNDFVDADRIDYTMRDPLASGVESIKIDMGRLCHGACVGVKELDEAADTSAGAGFHIAFMARALPAIEVFFLARHHLYKEIIYHHNVTRMNLIIQEIIVELLDGYLDGWLPARARGILETFKVFSGGGGKLFPEADTVVVDDSWLRTLLMLTWGEVKDSLSEESGGQTKLKKLDLLIDTFMNRRVGNVLSVWKREWELQEWLRNCCDREESGQGLYLAQRRDLASLFMQESSLVKQLENLAARHDAIMLYKKIAGKSFDVQVIESMILIQDGEQSKVPVVDISSYMRSLRRSSEDWFPQIFFVKEKIKDDASLIAEIINGAREVLRQILCDESKGH